MPIDMVAEVPLAGLSILQIWWLAPLSVHGGWHLYPFTHHGDLEETIIRSIDACRFSSSSRTVFHRASTSSRLSR
jgi:hypothetical protein